MNSILQQFVVGFNDTKAAHAITPRNPHEISEVTMASPEFVDVGAMFLSLLAGEDVNLRHPRISSRSQPQRGDHIIRPMLRNLLCVKVKVAWHHGIYLGNNRVADVHKGQGGEIVLSPRSYDMFLGPDRPPVQIVQHLDDEEHNVERFDLAARLAEVISGYGELHPAIQEQFQVTGRYRLLKNNCECFCNFVWTSRWETLQGTTYTGVVSPYKHCCICQ